MTSTSGNHINLVPHACIDNINPLLLRVQEARYHFHVGWGAGLGILGPGILVPGVLVVLASAALMMAVRIVFAVVAAVGECMLWGDWDSELGARRLEMRSGEPLTNGS